MTIDSAHSFLEEASNTMKARAQLRDAQGGERSMARTVAIFNAWTGNTISEDDGWRFMIALKQAREVQGKYNRDDYVDLSAYCGLLGEYESGSRPHPSAKVVFPQIDPGLLLKQRALLGTPVDSLARHQSIDAYDLQGSATHQVTSYTPDEPAGIPPLGSALDEV